MMTSQRSNGSAYSPGRHTQVGPIAALVLLLLLALALAGCAGDDTEFVDREVPVETLYQQARLTLLDGEYVEAAKLFDEVERQYPYSEWATRAQLMAAFSHYSARTYDDAVAALDRFIQLHPGNDDIDYAYYLRAMSHYERISDVGRDQKMTEEALDSLQVVVRRFPDSRYARDAQLKIDLALDHLAGKHMAIGRYYLRRSEYLAAINRFRLVIRSFQTTTHVPEALHRLVECYLALGVISEAQATAAVLGHNFPGSDWYLDSYALLTGEDLRPQDDDESWISGIWQTVF